MGCVHIWVGDSCAEYNCYAYLGEWDRCGVLIHNDSASVL